ncbi:MAG TPA: deoxyribodipyrimidine photo-lyase [Roseiflexaceae bacterium]|nr:deoxyribodipyrimidine photo-lyase [Roseiflexaceae bacterium]
MLLLSFRHQYANLHPVVPRDLRLRDNPALDAALRASGGQVVPLFILDNAILRAPDTSAARVTFLLQSLQALDQSLRAERSRLNHPARQTSRRAD